MGLIHSGYFFILKLKCSCFFFNSEITDILSRLDETFLMNNRIHSERKRKHIDAIVYYIDLYQSDKF